MTSKRVVGLVLASVLLGCSLPDVEPMPANPPSVVAALVVPWKVTSRKIEIFRSSQDDGRSPYYVKERSDLTAAQLQALEGMRFVVPSGRADERYHLVRITDRDGSVAFYGASQRGSSRATANPLSPTDGAIAYVTLLPFLRTARCTNPSEASRIRQSTAPLPPNDALVSVASPLALDEGCRSFLPRWFFCTDEYYTLEVATRATYEIALERCDGDFTLTAYEDTRTRGSTSRDIIATGVPGAAGECEVLRHTFDAGSHVIAVGKSNSSGVCPAGDADLGELDPRLARGGATLRARVVP